MREGETGAERVQGDGSLCCAPPTSGRIGRSEAAELAKVLSALADPVRLQLVSLVAANGEVCSCDLEEPLGKSQPTISHHTTVLVDAGLLRGRKEGRWTWWSLVPGRLAQVRAALGD